MKFVLSKRVRRQIEKIQMWWVENRPDAPALFLDELAEAERCLRATPTLGLIYTMHESGVVRRVPSWPTNSVGCPPNVPGCICERRVSAIDSPE